MVWAKRKPDDSTINASMIVAVVVVQNSVTQALRYAGLSEGIVHVFPLVLFVIGIVPKPRLLLLAEQRKKRMKGARDGSGNALVGSPATEEATAEPWGEAHVHALVIEISRRKETADASERTGPGRGGSSTRVLPYGQSAPAKSAAAQRRPDRQDSLKPSAEERFFLAGEGSRTGCRRPVESAQAKRTPLSKRFAPR
jgi:hypothetical protein